MNAIEHGNDSDPTIDVHVRVEAQGDTVTVAIRDEGGGAGPITAETPDMEAKLAGEQKPRGWGLFLIEKMVDEMRSFDDGTQHVIELVMHRGEA
jgi:anti-sigma regulatory factor (Ser/Thr protein kinase)